MVLSLFVCVSFGLFLGESLSLFPTPPLPPSLPPSLHPSHRVPFSVIDGVRPVLASQFGQGQLFINVIGIYIYISYQLLTSPLLAGCHHI